ncbi:unnamed protein product [Cuscuta epithymum]|uniref:BHLH domain-containing protein n=1 Tax=Cuscuta epithymum TaxID=186058 RepID=A0AAV0D0D3_9ASTE|nr:unnamed protein product [Cuscuta epithymum]
MTVLDRQAAVFHRFYQQPIHATDDAGNSFSGVLDGNLASLWNLNENSRKESANVLSRSNSSVTAVAAPTTLKLNARNTTTPGGRSTRKRKAEQCLEEKKWEAETGEAQSEITVKSERENSGNSASKQNKKASNENDAVQKSSNYIHVRARRGQATDSHSLAERARREKIGKKMKCLQDLVPGCNKVVGKAGMLDEIINYVQSLQKQVEFLSMKLAVLNPRLEYGNDHVFPKEVAAYMGGYSSGQGEGVNAAFLHHQWQQQLLATATSRGGSTESDVSVSEDVQTIMPQRKEHHNTNNHNNSSISIPDLYLESPYFSQVQGWESEWSTPFNASFH